MDIKDNTFNIHINISDGAVTVASIIILLIGIGLYNYFKKQEETQSVK